jgi:hypothetical protein
MLRQERLTCGMGLENGGSLQRHTVRAANLSMRGLVLGVRSKACLAYMTLATVKGPDST